MTTQRKVINLEQFYTQGSRAKSLSETIKNQPWFSNMTRVIEPAAGDGIWLDYMHVHEAWNVVRVPRDRKNIYQMSVVIYLEIQSTYV